MDNKRQKKLTNFSHPLKNRKRKYQFRTYVAKILEETVVVTGKAFGAPGAKILNVNKSKLVLSFLNSQQYFFSELRFHETLIWFIKFPVIFFSK